MNHYDDGQLAYFRKVAKRSQEANERAKQYGWAEVETYSKGYLDGMKTAALILGIKIGGEAEL